MKLSPEKFIWEKYCGKLGWSACQLLSGRYYETTECTLGEGVTYIGHCDANRLQVRNRAEGYAIMVEIEGKWTDSGEPEQTWFHSIKLPKGVDNT